jgi:hypothetical protein
MTTHSRKPDCLFVRVADWIKADAARRHETPTLSRIDLARMARDLGEDAAALRALVPAGSEAPDLLVRMMRSRGLDPASVQRHDPDLMRGLARTCSRCGVTAHCRHTVAEPTTVPDVYGFCPNDETLKALISARRRNRRGRDEAVTMAGE